MHHGITVVGQTESGQNVYDGLGCFKITESHGLPLDLLLEELKSRNSVIEMSGFLEAALKQGWTFDTILRKLEEGYVDVYGKQYWDEMSVRVKIFLTNAV